MNMRGQVQSGRVKNPDHVNPYLLIWIRYFTHLFPLVYPVELGKGAVEPLNGGSTAVQPPPALAAAAAPAPGAFLNRIFL